MLDSGGLKLTLSMPCTSGAASLSPSSGGTVTVYDCPCVVV